MPQAQQECFTGWLVWPGILHFTFFCKIPGLALKTLHLRVVPTNASKDLVVTTPKYEDGRWLA